MSEITSAFSKVPLDQRTERIEEAFRVLSLEETRRLYDKLNGMAENTWEGSEKSQTQITFANPDKRNSFIERQKEKKERMDSLIKASDEYYQTKYFENPEYFTNKVEGLNDDYFLTRKLIKKVAEREVLKADYVTKYVSKGTPFYMKITEMAEEEVPGAYKKKLYEETKWIIFLFGGVGLFLGLLKVVPEFVRIRDESLGKSK